MSCVNNPAEPMAANHGNPMPSSEASRPRGVPPPNQGDSAANANIATLPPTVPVITGVAEPSAPPLPPDTSSSRHPTQYEGTTARERANSNHIVETQLAYISNGPFSEELKQKLTQEVVLYATLDGTRSAAASRQPAANITNNASNPDDVRFCDEIQTALKISESTLQPNDPSVQPPVGRKQPMAKLIEACHHKPALQAKLHMLSPYFAMYRPVIGDGNCFYRSFAFGIIEFSMRGGEAPLEKLEKCEKFKDKVKTCVMHARDWLKTVAPPEIPGHVSFNARYRSLILNHMRTKVLCSYHVRLRMLCAQIAKAVQVNVDPVRNVLDVFQDIKGSSIMHLIRQLTAYEMLAHEEDYATFLPAIEGWWRTSVPQENLSVPLVVGHLVVVDGVEAEHVMIQAVSTLLGMCLAVVYADGQADPQVHIIAPARGMHTMDHPSMFLLFRDGHYDLVYPVDDSWRNLVAVAGETGLSMHRAD